jgi:hypothetical protein
MTTRTNRLADEYDAVQARGEVQDRGGNRKSKINVPDGNIDIPTITDIGLTGKPLSALLIYLRLILGF